MFHAVLLSPYNETQVHGPNFTRPPPDLVDGEEEYEVDKKGKWRIEYHVQWKGYEEPTWEPSENLSHAKELIRDYRKSNPRKRIDNGNPYDCSIKRLPIPKTRITSE